MTNEHSLNQLKIQKLNDEQLVIYLDKLFCYDRKLNQAIILTLSEIQSRRLYSFMGYASLFEMLVKHFKMSESAAYQRLNAMKLMNAVPAVHTMIENGNLSLTNAAMAQSLIQKIENIDDKKLTITEKQKIVESVCNKTQKEAQVMLAEIHPVASLPKTIEKPISAELIQIQIVLNKDSHENLQTLKSLYSHQVPDGNLNQIFELLINQAVQHHPMSKESRKKNGSIQLQTLNVNSNETNHSCEMKHEVKTIDDRIRSNSIAQLAKYNNINNKKKNNCRILENIDTQRTHVMTNKTTVRLNRNIKKIALKESEQNSESELNTESASDFESLKKHKKVQSSDEKKIVPNKAINKRYIQTSTKRFIFKRAAGQCEFKNEQGHRCQSRHQLEYDHIHSVSHGGGSEIENIQLLCRHHNQLKVLKTHGFLFNYSK